MSKYVMSDIHGCHDKFIEMLKLIDFREHDELYILGDIFDRGDKPLEILDYVTSHKNIHLIKGNHEQMFIDYFESGDAQLWYMNGGYTTHNQIIQRDFLYEESIYKYIRKLPYIKVVDKFILVHAGVFFPEDHNRLDLEEFIQSQDEDGCLWDRSNVGRERKYRDYTVICGHTPIQSIINSYDDVKILKRYGTIYIDCGCCFKQANGKLTCLRLEDMKEFYA